MTGLDTLSNSGTLAVADSIISGGYTGITNDGTATLANCTITANAGAGIENHGTVIINSCTVTNNAGGVYSPSTYASPVNPTVIISNTIIAGNATTNLVRVDTYGNFE